MANFKLKRGYDIPLDGEASSEIVSAPAPDFVAIKPIEFRGVKPRLVVKVGDQVKIGSPLAHAKTDESHIFTSPACGKVVAIERGHRRVLKAIVMECDGKNEAVEFSRHDYGAIKGLSREAVLDQVKQAGVLPIFIQRPFGKTADPNTVPRDIFVAGFDSAPLAPDACLQVQGNEAAYQAGLAAASRLTSGNVHVSIDGRSKDSSLLFSDDPNVLMHTFTGPHPAGCVGIQIHHINRIKGRNDAVWTTNVAGIVMLGKLFLEGRLAPERVITVAGTGATNRKAFRSTLGVSIKTLVGDNVSQSAVRHISGNVLAGKQVAEDGYVGFHDSLVTVIPEAVDHELIGWMLPGVNNGSYSRAYMAFLNPFKKVAKDTRLGGGYRAMVATGYYEQVMPMDLLPMYLIKSIMAEDFEEMEGLGIYEVLEEDLAICEYICPSKVEMQDILRQGLDLVEREG